MPKKRSKDYYLVAKHNELVEARYRLSVQEQRLITFMTSEINPRDEDFKPYRFQIREFAHLIGLEGEGYYSKLKNITRYLISKVITLKQGNKLIQVSWLSSAVYHEKEGWVELKFAPELKPYLLKLKRCFTQYQLSEMLKLRSKYAFRLYELCKKNELLGTYTYKIEDLRDMLGVGKGELKQWIHLKQYCLEPAIKEINQKTDLKVSYTPKKLGRRFKWIELKIKKKEKKTSIAILRDNTILTELLTLMPVKEREKKTLQSALIKAYKRYGFDYCKRNILYANEKAKDNYRVFLIKALKEDWALGWWEDTHEKVEMQNLLERIKNARISIGDEVVKTNEDGFVFLKNQVIPPGQVCQMIKEGKAKLK